MKKQHIVLKNLKWVLLACVILVAAGGVAAVNPFADIEYPVEELGNCQNREACKQFCDNPENMEPCLEFAKRIGLMSNKEVEKAKKMAEVGKMEGPGGCIGEVACEAYCDQFDHMRECIKFAEENDLIPPEELEEAKRVLSAIDQGITPPNCKGKRECDVYCSQVEHMEECIEFGIASGMMPPEEQEEAKKMLEALKRGVKPPNCNGKEECDVYCSAPENMEECMEFGIEAGFMPPHEVEKAKKMLKALKAGVKPPDCRGDRECDEYCRKPENMEECMDFSIAAGFAPPEEIEMMEKTLKAIKSGVMPPDCKSDEECRVYCDKEENRQQCMDFSVAAGFMTEEEAEMMQKTGGKGPGGCGSEEECRAFCDNIDNARECIQFGVKMGEISQEEADQMIRDMGGAMGSIFDCTTKEECEKFCQSRNNDNELMCIQFRMVKGEITQEEAERILEKEILSKGPGGPGGCRTIEECRTYCSQEGHMEECMRFTTGGRMGEVELRVGSMQIQPSLGGCKTPEECEEFCSRPENAQECMGPQGADGIIAPREGEQWRPEDDEYLKQRLQAEYGDDWQKIYDEKTRQRMEGMSSDEYAPEGLEGAWKEPYQEGPPPEQWMGPEGEWQEPYKEGMPQDQWYGPEGEMMPQGEFDMKSDFSPEGVNNMIYDAERSIREGVIYRSETDDGYIKEEWRSDSTDTRIYEEGMPEPFLGEPRQDIEYDIWQEPKEGEWQGPEQDTWQAPESGEWTETSSGGGSADDWGEVKVYEEPIPGEWNDGTTDGQPDSWREPVPAYDSDYQDSIYQEPISESNPQPMPGTQEPISESNPQPMPDPEQPVYNIMPVPEPPPTVEPTPMTEPTPEPPQSLLAPFKKFLGTVAEFLSK